MALDVLAFYAYCLGGLEPGLAQVLTEIAGRPPMEARRAISHVATSCAGRVCRVTLRRLAEGGLAEGTRRPALAYAVAWLRVAGAIPRPQERRAAGRRERIFSAPEPFGGRFALT